MKKLIIVRHGHHVDDILSAFGKMQIQRLAEELKKHVTDERAVLLSSRAPRAIQGSEILSTVLGIKFETHEILYPGCIAELDGVLNLVRTHKENADVIILMTHLEYTEHFPPYFSEHELKVAPFMKMKVDMGQAWVIDCVDKTMDLIAPIV